jgi:DNA-binding response OmpR family regulator
MPALNAEWGFDDVVLSTAGPGEVDARIRLLTTKGTAAAGDSMISASGVTIDEVSYQAKANGRALDLTYKEFELLRFLAGHPQRVFTREQLLSEVWGYDYFGGTRTVDVHVRRLRAKLGDMESLIGTVRNVGYRFTIAEASEEVKNMNQHAPSTPHPTGP